MKSGGQPENGERINYNFKNYIYYDNTFLFIIVKDLYCPHSCPVKVKVDWPLVFWIQTISESCTCLKNYN